MRFHKKRFKEVGFEENTVKEMFSRAAVCAQMDTVWFPTFGKFSIMLFLRLLSFNDTEKCPSIFFSI
jgi:hypothetical protein